MSSSQDHAQSTTDGQGNPALAASEAALSVVRTIAGETVAGFKVAAWRVPARCPPGVAPEAFEAFFRHGKPHEYAEHWSTLPEGAERLFTEADLLAALSDGAGHGTASTSDQQCSSREAIK